MFQQRDVEFTFHLEASLNLGFGFVNAEAGWFKAKIFNHEILEIHEKDKKVDG